MQTDSAGNILMVATCDVVVAIPPDTPFESLATVMESTVRSQIRMPLTSKPGNIHPFKSFVELLETGPRAGFGSGAWIANRDLAIAMVDKGQAPTEIAEWVAKYLKEVATKPPTVFDHFGPSVTK